MRRRSSLVVVIAAAVCFPLQVTESSMAAQAMTSGFAPVGAARLVPARWDRAIQVPGTGSLNAGGEAFVLTLACGSAGNCAAGGMYRDRAGRPQAFLVTQSRGRWGKAEEVPGTALLNAGGNAGIVAVSCPLAGRCTAVGLYSDRRGRSRTFTVAERNSSWGKVAAMPGLTALSAGGDAEPWALSCASAGDCSAVGSYTDSRGHQEVFVDSARNGRWGNATELPGLAALSTGSLVEIGAVSCPEPGDCSTGGGFSTGPSTIEAFVDDQRQGRWGTAKEVPGTAALNVGGNADLGRVTCPMAGSCSAAGVYVDASGNTQAFVVAEKNGIWGRAFEVPGTAALNAAGNAGIDSISCARPGDCSAGGFYRANPSDTEAFVITEKQGRWGKAMEAPGTAGLNTAGNAIVNSVSCWAPGWCSAGGDYSAHSGQQAFVIIQQHGIWGKAQQVPGTRSLNAGGAAAIYSMSCGSPGWCSAGGFYWDRAHHAQAFVVSRT